MSDDEITPNKEQIQNIANKLINNGVAATISDQPVPLMEGPERRLMRQNGVFQEMKESGICYNEGTNEIGACSISKGKIRNDYNPFNIGSV